MASTGEAWLCSLFEHCMEPQVTASQLFGHIGETPVHSFRLGQPDGLQAEVLQYGGILRSLSFASSTGRKELVLGLPTLADYRRDTAYLGVIAVRFANRIDVATFELDAQRFQLTANKTANHLQGGAVGFGRRVWQMLMHHPKSCLWATDPQQGRRDTPARCTSPPPSGSRPMRWNSIWRRAPT